MTMQRGEDSGQMGVALLLLGGAAIVGGLLYSRSQSQPAPAPSPGPTPGPGPKPGPVPPPNACPGVKPGAKPCQPGIANPATQLTFEVTPWNPRKEVGQRVAYTGRVLEWRYLPLPGWYVLPFADVEFWDNNKCQGFLSAKTDSEGFYQAVRYLQPDELDGYDVFAFYRGSVDQNHDPAVSGVWGVCPQW